LKVASLCYGFRITYRYDYKSLLFSDKTPPMLKLTNYYIYSYWLFPFYDASPIVC